MESSDGKNVYFTQVMESSDGKNVTEFYAE